MRFTHAVAAAFVLAVFAAGTGFAQMMPAGLYVRGDVGGGFAQNLTFTDVSPSAPNCDLCGATFPAKLSNSVIVGGGIGYRFSPIWRADVTADYLPSLRGSGTSTQTPPDSGTAPLSSLAILANGYLDLAGLAPAAFGPLQPYVVAGIGFTRNDLGTFTGSSVGVPVSESGASTTNFAWDAGAGVGYPITPNLTLDIGYRFIDLGDFRTGTSVAAAGAPLPPVTASKSNDLGIHTIMASLRFGF